MHPAHRADPVIETSRVDSAAPEGFVSTSCGILVPAGAAPPTARRRPRIRLAVLTGVVLGLALFLLACAGLSLLVSLASIIAVASGYDVLAKRGVLPTLSGPWLDPP